MPLSEGQVQVRDLVMGPGTPYRLADEINPWSRRVRADQRGPRVWTHGTWSGAEWADENVVPMRIVTIADDVGSWLAYHQQLLAAFAPSHEDVEMRFVRGGKEYVIFGRPRLVEPETRLIRSGVAYTQCAFVGLDPRIYSGVQHTAQIGLAVVTGGLTLPFTVPFAIEATTTSGRITLSNAGTASCGLRLRIDGPVANPIVSLITVDGTMTLQFLLTLTSGQWLDVDTAERTVLLNGTASRRGNTTGTWPELPRGLSELFFTAPVYDPAARVTATWRDAWL